MQVCHSAASEQAAQGCGGPTGLVDAQDQREPALGTSAGDGHRAENHHLVLPTVLRHLKGLWDKLASKKEEEARQPGSLRHIPGQEVYLQSSKEALAFLRSRPAAADVGEGSGHATGELQGNHQLIQKENVTISDPQQLHCDALK